MVLGFYVTTKIVNKISHGNLLWQRTKHCVLSKLMIIAFLLKNERETCRYLYHRFPQLSPVFRWRHAEMGTAIFSEE